MFPSAISIWITPDSKAHGASSGPTWVLSAPDGPNVGPIVLSSLGWSHDCRNTSEVYPKDTGKLKVYLIKTNLQSGAVVLLLGCAVHLTHRAEIKWPPLFISKLIIQKGILSIILFHMKSECYCTFDDDSCSSVVMVPTKSISTHVFSQKVDNKKLLCFPDLMLIMIT